MSQIERRVISYDVSQDAEVHGMLVFDTTLQEWVRLVGVNGQLSVSVNPQGQIVEQFAEELNVAFNTLTNILSYTNSTGSTLFLDEIVVGGLLEGEFHIVKEGVLIKKFITTPSKLSEQLSFKALKLDDTETLIIKIIHSENGKQGDFFSSFSAHE